MGNDKIDEKLVGRLDAVISLLAENMIATGVIGKGRAIEILYKAGLTPTEIGKIFHLPRTSIGGIISNQRRQDRTRKKSRK